MEAPLPLVAPETPFCTTVHENVVPETLLFKVMFVGVEEQIV